MSLPSLSASRISAAALNARAHELIPAGCHTYSKGDDQFPQNAPRFIARGKGSLVWDTDGREFLDWGMGLRSVILGHAYPAVTAAVAEHLQWGSNFVRPAPIEVELAEVLVDLIPCAEMVKFAKDGSDVTAGAVRLARAFTNRDVIALCREDPFYSFHDWFIATTACNAGIPKVEQDLAVKFSYNDIASLEQAFAEHPDAIAAVILEPVSTQPPHDDFLRRVRELTRRHGAVLIFDEIITGFRWHVSGAQAYFGVTPDLATFGKAIANGFSVSAVTGRRDIMELGGIRHTNREKVFLLSATHGGETHSLAAALATIAEIQRKEVVEHIWAVGSALQEGINGLAREAGIQDHIWASGYPCSPVLNFRDRTGEASYPLRTLFLQELVESGVLMPYIAVSFSHGQPEVDRTLEAMRQALRVCRRGLEEGLDGLIRGPVVKPVFRKFN